MYVLSLILGFAAWALPVVAIFSKKPRPGFSTWSFALCSCSLASEIYQTNILVNKGDWSSILDTFFAINFAAMVLLIVTVVLNGISLIVSKRKVR